MPEDVGRAQCQRADCSQQAGRPFGGFPMRWRRLLRRLRGLHLAFLVCGAVEWRGRGGRRGGEGQDSQSNHIDQGLGKGLGQEGIAIRWHMHAAKQGASTARDTAAACAGMHRAECSAAERQLPPQLYAPECGSRIAAHLHTQ